MAAPFPSPTTKWHDNTYASLSPSRPELSAKGKTVLITGGGTGIGARTAQDFAEAGASRIALLGRREQPLLDTKTSIQQRFPDVEIFVASTDVTNRSQVDVAFAKFVGTSKIDVLVSNAAIIGPQDPVKDVDANKFLEAINTNLKGSLNVAQAFLPHAAPDAVVIEVNSSAAHFNFGPGFASYSVAKLAVFRLWDSVAFANPNLCVFHVQPGVVNTDMNKESGGVAAVGFEDDVSLPASFNVWLASPEARFLKGKFLWSNWDVDELKARAKEIEAGEQFNIGLVGWPFSEKNAGFKIAWKSENLALNSA
ncbi:oxidoreductase [Rhexocercosporidium sp. MPI-PUGE-AT-0058]|nr:oxidoreductase [Rhexocercosporidium sp. MPI-PUGE-AT-0058]